MNEPSPSHPTSLDPLVLDRLRELDPDGRHGVLRRVLEAFELSLMRMLAQLAAELDDGDAKVISTIAHTLRSSSAAVGALGLSAACARVEDRLREGGAGDLRADVELLVAHGESALLAVRAMLIP